MINIPKKSNYNWLDVFVKITTIILIAIIFIYIYSNLIRLFLSPHINGDESKFLIDLIKANTTGFINTINNGTSITFLTISFQIDKIFNDALFSIRFTSLLSGIILFIYFEYIIWKVLKFSKLIKIHLSVSLLYLLVLQATIFTGCNDILLDLFSFFFLVLSIYSLNKKSLPLSIMIGLFLALTLATRKMSIIFLVIFFVLTLIQSYINQKTRDKAIYNQIIILLSFTLAFVILNITSLYSTKQFSFDDKILIGEVNWAQWEYHNALLIDRGEQERFHHVSIDETKKYLEIKGKTSLPNSFIGMITFDPILTIKEFFIDTGTGIKYFFRQTGFWIILYFIFLNKRLKQMIDKSHISSIDFMYLFSILCFLIICFIVITNIQMRWFTYFIPIVLVLLAKDLSQIKIIHQKLFVLINNLVLIIMSTPFIYRMFI